MKQWGKVKLGEVLKHRKGFVIIDDNTEYKLCRVQLHRKGVVLREKLFGHQIQTKKQQVCKAGDFLVAEMDAKVGGYGFVPQELDGAIVSSHYFLFEIDVKKIRPQYLEVISQLKVLQEQIKAVGSTNYAAIRPANVLEWDIPLPPIEKQIEIEEIYLRCKNIINKIDKELSFQLTQLENLNQAILQEAVQGKLVPQNPADESASILYERIKAEKNNIGLKPISGQSSLNSPAFKGQATNGRAKKELPPIKPEEIPFEIPESWVWCRLGEIVRITGGGTPSMMNSEYWSGNIPWVSPKDMKAEFIFDSEMKITEKAINETTVNLIPQGSILIVGRSGILKRKVPVALNMVECTVNQDMKVYIPFLLKMNRYLQFMFLGLEQIILSRFVKFGMTVHSLKYDEFAQMPIPLPPLSEQTRIVTEIEKQLAKTKQLKAHIIANQQATEQLLKALLHEAFEINEAKNAKAEEKVKFAENNVS